MSIDLTKLDDYIVIQVGAQPADQVPDLRELDQQFGDGVYGLWSDALQGIIAFAFNKVQWDAAQAKAWVELAKQGDMQAAAEGGTMPYKSMQAVNPAIKGIKPPVTLAQANQIAEMADAMEKTDNPPENPWAAAIAQFKESYTVKDGKWVKKDKSAVAARSFDEIRTLVEQAIVKRFGGSGDPRLVDSVWVNEIGPEQAIYFHQGQDRQAEYFAITYAIGPQGEVTLGEPEPVQRGWRYDNDAPVVLHAYDSILAATDQGEDDGLIWKELIKPGAWYKMDTGRRVAVTSDIIQEAYRAFGAGLPKLVSVPADNHHGEIHGSIPAEDNRGFVPRLKLVGDSLYGGFKLTDPQVAAGVQDGSIADCSVYLQPDVTHPATGEKFPWVLRHVLLTNNPLVQDLRPFGDIPADGESGVTVVYHYRQAPGNRQEVTMPDQQDVEHVLTGADEIVLTGDAAREYGALSALGLTAEQLRTLVSQRDAIAAQAAALRTKAREMEVLRVVKALEGGDTHTGVAQLEGYRHYPVVISAVEKALREGPAALALDANDDGVSPLDAAVLSVVNALPAEARVKLDAQPDTSKQPVQATAGAAPTDAQIDALLVTIS